MTYPRKKYFTHLVAIFLIALAAVVAYGNSLDSPFLFDDLHNIVGNKNLEITDFSFDSLKRAATEGPSEHRWLPKITFAINYFYADKVPVGYHSSAQLEDHSFLEPDPWGYHLVNILIHLATGISLYLLFLHTLALSTQQKQLANMHEIALMAALLWVAHPVQTNAVTYIVQRMTSMSALLFVWTILFYIQGRRNDFSFLRRATFFVLSIICALLALISKQNAAILPVILLGYEIYFLKGIDFSFKNKKNILALGGALLLVLIIGSIYIGDNLFTSIPRGYNVRDFTMEQRLLTQPRVILHYFSLLMLPLPSRLTLAYQFPTSLSFFAPLQTILAHLWVAGLVLLMFFLFKRYRMISFAIFWYLSNLIIESSFVPLEMVFEHRLYVPSAFVFLAIVLACYRPVKRMNFARYGFLLAAILLVFFTWQRNETWSSRESIWEDVAIKSPGLSRGYMGLFVTYKTQGRDAEALQMVQKAVAVAPDEFRPSYNLARVYVQDKQYKDALRVLNEMLRKPHLQTEKTFQLRAAVYLDLQNYPRAIQDGLQAFKINPNHVNTLTTLGAAYFRLGKFTDALQYFEKAQKIDPDTYGIYFNLATTYYNLGMYDPALENYRKALALAPNNPDIHYNIGMIYGAKGMIREMQREMEISRRLRGQSK